MPIMAKKVNHVGIVLYTRFNAVIPTHREEVMIAIIYYA
jgi:hypothetical protein